MGRKSSEGFDLIDHFLHRGAAHFARFEPTPAQRAQQIAPAA
jgi:hypothetical protein